MFTLSDRFGPLPLRPLLRLPNAIKAARRYGKLTGRAVTIDKARSPLFWVVSARGDVRKFHADSRQED